MASHWQDQYLAALTVRDRREQALQSTYDDYAKLADLAASLSKQLAACSGRQLAEPAETATTAGDSKRPPTLSTAQSPENDVIIGLRTDLASAQATRTTLTAELASLKSTLTSLQVSLTRTSTTANSLARDKALLERKLRDRDEELREKRKMLEGVLDEVVALTMQVNLLEQERDGVREKVG